MGILDMFKKKNNPTPENPAPAAVKTETPQPETTAIPIAEEVVIEETIIEETFIEETIVTEAPQATEPEAPVEQEIPLLPFEALMQKAAADVNLRFDFYRSLPQQQVYVITSPNTQAMAQDGALKDNTNVELATFPDGKIPFFTTLPRIFEKNVVKEQVPYLEMKAGDLFGLTKGATLVLNPFSDFGKELVPQEIEQILDGSIFGESIREVAVPRDTQVRIGQPAILPTAMLDKLISVFSDRDDVNAAYLAVVDMIESGNPPRLLIAMDISGDRQTIFEETGRTAQQFLQQGESIDIMELSPDNGISTYFDDQQPFFTRG